MRITTALAFGATLAGCAAPSPVTLDPAHLKLSQARRDPITLPASDRAYMLGEMRLYLDTVGALADAIAHGDKATVRSIAESRGFSAQANRLPRELEAQLPEDFRTRWISSQLRLDEVADAAAHSGAPEEMLGRLALLMGRCNACHAAYRFE